MKFSQLIRIVKGPLIITVVFLCSCDKNPPFEPDPPLVVCKQNDNSSIHTNAERFGFFSEDIYKDYVACLTSFTSKYGAKPAYILRFQQIDDPFPTDFVNYYSANSIHAVISLNIISNKANAGRNDTLLREITSGLWDSTLQAFAINAKQIDTKIYLRFGYEMNGPWFKWGNKPNEFIPAWIHAHKIFKDEKANNVVWIFSPNVLWDGTTTQDNLVNFYPGDSVVDIIGLDGYNFGDIVKDNVQLHWRSFHDVFYTSLMAFNKIDKPIWITEVGCPTDSRRPDWLKELFNFMESNTCVDAMLWFDAHKENEPDFQLSSDSASLYSIRNWLSGQ
jgi:mannan endo-1,4-beta-mannosidase